MPVFNSPCVNSSTCGCQDKTVIMLSTTFMEEFLSHFTFINTMVFTPLVSVTGIVTNIINIVVFIKLGAFDSMNMTFLSLAISDLISVLALMQYFTLCPLFYPAGARNGSSLLLVVSTPFTWANNVASWITAFAALERYLCVKIPLKIKATLTTRRRFVVIIAIYILSSIPATIVLVERLSSRPLIGDPGQSRNQTRFSARTLLTDVFYVGVNISRAQNHLAYLLVVLLTILIVLELRTKTQWRLRATAQNSSATTRSLSVARMVVFICIMFIIFSAPANILLTVSLIEETSGYTAVKDFELRFSLTNLMMTIQSINSSVNAFMYLKMSSKYRDKFTSLFRGTRN